MYDAVPPTTPGGSRTTISYYDVRITYKLNIHPDIYSPAAIYFTTKTANQDKPPSLSPVPTLQAGQDLNHIE